MMYSHLIVLIVLFATCVDSSFVLRNPHDKEYAIPGPITIKDSSGQDTTELRFTVLDDIIVYTVHCNYTYGSWSINPTLPTGLIFDTKSLTITGTPATVNSTILYTISQEEGGVTVSTIISLTVGVCSSGFNYRALYATGPMQFVISHGENILRNITLNAVREFCLPVDGLTVSVECSSRAYNGCTFYLAVTDDLCVLSFSLKEREKQSYHVSTITTVVPKVIVTRSKDYGVTGRTFYINLVVTGNYYAPTFDPPLPNGYVFHLYSGSITTHNAPYGKMSTKMTLRNDIGTITTEIVFMVDICPDGLEMLGIRRIGYGDTDNITVYDRNEKQVYYGYMNGDHYDNLCLPRGDYSIRCDFLSPSNKKNNYPIVIVDESLKITRSLLREYSMPTQWYSISLGRQIFFGSTIRFLTTSSIDSKWRTKGFKDKNWKESTSSNWGNYSPNLPTVYFRKQFSLDDPISYNLVNLDVLIRDGAIVYMNGNEVVRYNLDYSGVSGNTVAPRSFVNVTSMRTLLSTQFLVKGTNQLSIEIHRSVKTSTNAAIDFDVSINIVKSALVPLLYKGIAIDEPVQTNQYKKAQVAFSIGSGNWESIAVPVNLTFMITDNRRDWVDRVQFYGAVVDSNPIEMTIQGLVTSRDESGIVKIVDSDTIGHVNDVNFLFLRDYYEVNVTPRRPYDGFRFIITKGYNNTNSIQINKIKFFTYGQQSCKKRWGYNSIRVGESLTGKCPAKSIGVRMMHCSLNVNLQPVWITDDSMCIDRYPPKGSAYVDTVFTVTNLRDYLYSSMHSALVKISVQNLTIWDNQISFPVTKFFDSNGNTRSFTMRFTVEEAIGDHVSNHQVDIIPKLVEAIKPSLVYAMRPYDISIGKPSYRYPFPWHWVGWGVTALIFYLVTIIFTVSCTFLTMRSKMTSGSMPMRKRLSRGKKNEIENANLLTE